MNDGTYLLLYPLAMLFGASAAMVTILSTELILLYVYVPRQRMFKVAILLWTVAAMMSFIAVTALESI